MRLLRRLSSSYTLCMCIYGLYLYDVYRRQTHAQLFRASCRTDSARVPGCVNRPQLDYPSDYNLHCISLHHAPKTPPPLSILLHIYSRKAFDSMECTHISQNSLSAPIYRTDPGTVNQNIDTYGICVFGDCFTKGLAYYVFYVDVFMERE